MPLLPKSSSSFPAAHEVEAPCLSPRAGFKGHSHLPPQSTSQFWWVGWLGLAGGPRDHPRPLPCPLCLASSGAHSILPPLLCQAALVHPDPHRLPTLSLSRHLGSVPSCSPGHGCQGDVQGPAALWLCTCSPSGFIKSPLISCVSSLASLAPASSGLSSSPGSG